MNDEARLAMIRDAQYAHRAGVVLSLKDWKKMSHDERGAWIVALERPRLDGDGAPPIPPPPEVHDALVASATRVASGKE